MGVYFDPLSMVHILVGWGRRDWWYIPAEDIKADNIVGVNSLVKGATQFAVSLRFSPSNLSSTRPVSGSRSADIFRRPFEDRGE